MKTKYLLTALVITILTCSNTFTQAYLADYFPLKTGNIFFYKVFIYGPHAPETTYVKCTIIKDTLIFNKKFFYISNFPGTLNQNWYRFDTLSGNITRYTLYESIVDSLNMRKGDITNGGEPGNSWRRKCMDTSDIEVFGILSKSKAFIWEYSWPTGSGSIYRKYAKGFGIVYTGTSYEYEGRNYYLIGCKINGIVYGDTSAPIGIIKLSNAIPKEFILYQNYPNPFNPKTIIRFQINRLSDLKLVVYDITGKEIAILLNEEQRAGTYEVDFNGSNYSSGIYFYQLTVDTKEEVFRQTKKMLMVK